MRRPPEKYPPQPSVPGRRQEDASASWFSVPFVGVWSFWLFWRPRPFFSGALHSAPVLAVLSIFGLRWPALSSALASCSRRFVACRFRFSFSFFLFAPCCGCALLRSVVPSLAPTSTLSQSSPLPALTCGDRCCTFPSHLPFAPSHALTSPARLAPGGHPRQRAASN